MSLQVLVEFWLNQYEYSGSQGDLLTQAQVKNSQTRDDPSCYFSSSVDANSRAAHAAALCTKTGTLLQQWFHLLFLFSLFIAPHLPHASH